MMAAGYESTFSQDFNNDGLIGQPLAEDTNSDGFVDDSRWKYFKIYDHAKSIHISLMGRIENFTLLLKLGDLRCQLWLKRLVEIIRFCTQEQGEFQGNFKLLPMTCQELL